MQRKISFDRDGVTLVGNLITPDACSPGEVWPARSRGVQRPLSFFDVATDRVTGREAQRARPPGC
ncbi:hypothetical protein [Streptomyces anthocyanicus]|uniref:hypothetical protein n=1 Tax=Streptomyces anthocyanicus TaxID=68174 RepID=UPI0038290287